MSPIYGYNYGYVQSNFNQTGPSFHPSYFQNGFYPQQQTNHQYVPLQPEKVKSRSKEKKQRLLSGQNDSFTRSDISTETTSTTNTSYSAKRKDNSRKSPKKNAKTPR